MHLIYILQVLRFNRKLGDLRCLYQWHFYVGLSGARIACSFKGPASSTAKEICVDTTSAAQVARKAAKALMIALVDWVPPGTGHLQRENVLSNTSQPEKRPQACCCLGKKAIQFGMFLTSPLSEKFAYTDSYIVCPRDTMNEDSPSITYLNLAISA